MKPLPKDLQTPKKSLNDFFEATKRVLGHLPDIVSERVTARDYIILSSVVAGTSKYARPINNNLFIFDSSAFDTEYKKFLSVLGKIKDKKAYSTKKITINFQTNSHELDGKAKSKIYKEFVEMLIGFINKI